GLLERGLRLALQRVPSGEILLEGLGPRRRQHHPLAFERETGAVFRKAGIVAPQLVEQIFRVAQLAQRFFPQLVQIGSAGALTSLADASALARRFFRTVLPRAAALTAGALERAPGSIEVLPQLLRAGERLR